MNPQKRKLQHQTDEQLSRDQQVQGQQQQSVREFGSVDELIRHDAQQVVVPPHIAARVQDSVAREPHPRSWWGRLFGR